MALSNAERQRRWRQRRRQGEAKIAYRTPKDRRSRARQLRDAAGEIIRIREECRAWREALPESLESSSTAEMLDEALETLDGIDLEALEDLDLPRGYGRDG